MEPDARIAAVAAVQHGVFTRAQAQAAGISDRMAEVRVRQGRWLRLFTGVYALAGTAATWDRRLHAAWLAAGPHAVVSHASAARLWELPREGGTDLELTLPRYRRQGPRGVRSHRGAEVARVDRTGRGGLQVTTPTMTLIHLAGRLDAVDLARDVDHCLRRRLTTPAYVRRRLLAIGRRGRAGVALLDEVLAARPSGGRVPDSEFEYDLLALLARLPGGPPVPQYEVRRPGGEVVRFDAAYPQERVAVEGDSYLWHSSRIDWSRDHTATSS